MANLYADNIAARDSQCIGEFGRLEATLDALNESIKNLESRLSGLLRPRSNLPPPSPGKVVDEPLVPVAERIRSIRRKLEDYATELSSIRDSLEN